MTKPLVFEAWPLCIADRLTRITERSTPLRILPVPRNSWHHRRYSELVAKGATPQLTVDNFKTQGDTLWAAIRADNAALENLKVQLSFCFIRAPITGRISQAAVKVGNFARSADTIPIATINQIAPVYVTMSVPQRSLPDLRVAMAESDTSVEAIIPGETRRARGTIAMIENAVDPTTGMATVRASMPNEDELLWPGTLVTAHR